MELALLDVGAVVRDGAVLNTEPALVFAALADPNRRRIIELLARQGAATASSLSVELSISRQAVAKHLAQLAAAGLASSTRSGRETRFEAHTEGLESVTAWVERVEDEWGHRLGLLARFAETEK